jgi:dipeptidyl aminopeptidase/acylaminoacyl peptidase
MLKRFFPFVFVALLAAPCYPADAVFGRRVYTAAGRSYEQIWTLDAASRHIAPLTRTPRRHAAPVCSPDGARIWFLSGTFGDESNTELWWFDRRTRTETLAVRVGGSVVSLLGGTGSQAFLTAYEAGAAGLYRWADGHLTKLANVTGAALAPDARSLAAEAGAPGSVTMMEPGGARGLTLQKCSGPLWSPDGRRLACVAGQTVRIVNLTTGVETAHADFTQRATPPAVADFSPDGTRLLVGTVGANHSSTSPQSDYWVLDLANGKWTFVGPGQSAVFAPGKAGAVLLATPRELRPAGKVQEWVSQLLLVDPATHAQTPVAAGAAANSEPCRCAPAVPAAAPVKSRARK